MIRKLNFNKADLFEYKELLVFINPVGSMLYRVYWVPEGYLPLKENEIEQVLNTLCIRKHNNIWYFDLRDPETKSDIEDIFSLMRVMHLLIELEYCNKKSD